MQLRPSAVDTRSYLVCTIISLDQFRIKDRNHMMKILQGSNQREKERWCRRSWHFSSSLPTRITGMPSYFLYLPYIVSRDGHIRCYHPKEIYCMQWTDCNPSSAPSTAAISTSFADTVSVIFARVCVTGAQLALFIITLSTSLYFWRGSLLWPDFPIPRPPIASSETCNDLDKKHPIPRRTHK